MGPPIKRFTLILLSYGEYRTLCECVLSCGFCQFHSFLLPLSIHKRNFRIFSLENRQRGTFSKEFCVCARARAQYFVADERDA